MNLTVHATVRDTFILSNIRTVAIELLTGIIIIADQGIKFLRVMNRGIRNSLCTDQFCSFVSFKMFFVTIKVCQFFFVHQVSRFF